MFLAWGRFRRRQFLSGFCPDLAKSLSENPMSTNTTLQISCTKTHSNHLEKRLPVPSQSALAPPPRSLFPRLFLISFSLPISSVFRLSSLSIPLLFLGSDTLARSSALGSLGSHVGDGGDPHPHEFSPNHLTLNDFRNSPVGGHMASSSS